MIGFFDSGFGGLTVMKAVIDRLPEYDFMFLGDNARAPFGGKSQEVILEYTRQAVDFLFEKGCELIIVACNTASAEALRKIQQEHLPKKWVGKRVLGVVIPVAETAIEHLGKNAIVGVIGTKATVRSDVWDRELKKLAPDIKLYKKACPLLVPLIEEGWIKKPETKMILRKYLRDLKTKNIKGLILGCTHFPLLKRQIQEIMGGKCEVLDAPVFVAERLVDYLQRHPDIDTKIGKSGRREFFTTDDPVRFREMGEMFLGSRIDGVEKVIYDG